MVNTAYQLDGIKTNHGNIFLGTILRDYRGRLVEVEKAILYLFLKCEEEYHRRRFRTE